MKRPLRSTLVIVTTSLLVAGGLAVSAQGHHGQGAWGHGAPGMHGGGGHGPLGGIMRELGLTDEQRAQVHARIDEAMAGELGQLLREHLQMRDELRQQIHDPRVDENTIADAVRVTTADAERLALAEHRLAVSLFDVLTPEQREQALELLADPARVRANDRRMERRRIDPDAQGRD